MYVGGIHPVTLKLASTKVLVSLGPWPLKEESKKFFLQSRTSLRCLPSLQSEAALEHERSNYCFQSVAFKTTRA